MKKDKFIYWTATSIIFFFDSVIPALTSHTALAKEGIAHLGYPDYFRIQLTIFKVIGGVILILPMASSRLKEWAYAGFTISFISAFTGHLVIDGPVVLTFLPLFILLILLVSYIYYHKIRANTALVNDFNNLAQA